MLHIGVQVKGLVASNLNTLVERASDPVRMLRKLQHELQEAIVALQGDLSRARRSQERLTEDADKHDRAAAEWTDKAKLAMDHKREDLARAALLAREQTYADAAKAREEAATAASEADEVAAAMAELEATLAETNGRLADEVARAQAGGGSAAPGAAASRSERFMDRVTTLEKRVDFATGQRPQPAPASVDDEIERLRRDAKVSEELAAMKAASKAAPAKKKASAKR
jgi:phage shock protein A